MSICFRCKQPGCDSLCHIGSLNLTDRDLLRMPLGKNSSDVAAAGRRALFAIEILEAKERGWQRTALAMRDEAIEAELAGGTKTKIQRLYFDAAMGHGFVKAQPGDQGYPEEAFKSALLVGV